MAQRDVVKRMSLATNEAIQKQQSIRRNCMYVAWICASGINYGPASFVTIGESCIIGPAIGGNNTSPPLLQSPLSVLVIAPQYNHICCCCPHKPLTTARLAPIPLSRPFVPARRLAVATTWAHTLSLVDTARPSPPPCHLFAATAILRHSYHSLSRCATSGSGETGPS